MAQHGLNTLAGYGSIERSLFYYKLRFYLDKDNQRDSSVNCEENEHDPAKGGGKCLSLNVALRLNGRGHYEPASKTHNGKQTH